MTGRLPVDVDIRTTVTEAVADDADWATVGTLVQQAIQLALSEAEQMYGTKRVSIVSTDTALIEHRGERRFLVTVVTRAT
jgi:hypothetical protein